MFDNNLAIKPAKKTTTTKNNFIERQIKIKERKNGTGHKLEMTDF